MTNLTEVYRVKEFDEECDVKFLPNEEVCVGYNRETKHCVYAHHDIVQAFNEGGYCCVKIDAYRLYQALKDIYENQQSN